MTEKPIPHPGYDFGWPDYTTKRNLEGYTEIHNFDFAKFVRDKKLTRGTVVDLGCGNGFFLRDLLNMFPKMKVLGIDKKLYQHQLPNFQLADITDLSSVPNEFADLVVSSAVTQWIHEKKHRAYEEAARILKPAGYGFIFPFSEPEHSIQTSGKKFQLRNLEKGPAKVSVPQLIMGKITPRQIDSYSL